MEKKQLTLILGSILGIGAFLAIAYMLTNTPKTTFFPQLTQVTKTDHTKWGENAEVVLVEYSDFQCPGCGAFAGVIQALQLDQQFVKEIQPNITFVYRYFPLDSIHANARAAAYAAEAAGFQDAFFPMHDMLFARQDEWSEEKDPTPLFTEYAKAIELDIEQFAADYQSQKVKDIVEQSYQSGIKAQVKGTPSFFLNGTALKLPNTPDEFKNILLQSLQ